MEKRCNACGKILISSDHLSVTKDWGYFSRKDMCRDSYVMCEECYDIMTEGFLISVDRRMITEI